MRRSTMIVALGLAAAMGAVTAVPAAADEAASPAFCGPLTSPGAAFTSPGSTPSLLGRGSQVREPDLGQLHQDLPARAKGKTGSGFSASVPVYFHVITDGKIGNVTNSQIAAQIAVLNQTYAGREGGYNTGFTFVLAGVTRTDNADWFYTNPGGTDEHSMKLALHAGGSNALNWYSTTAGDYLGWAYLPDILTKPGQAYLDGVVVDWESMLRTSATYAGQYDQGETGTHEVGHWLNLEHTFYGGCGAKGDFVDDTPKEKTSTSGCPIGKDTCTAPGLDPIHNYMDYSYDSCYTEFTAGQAQRMRDAWLYFRAL